MDVLSVKIKGCIVIAVLFGLEACSQVSQENIRRYETTNEAHYADPDQWQFTSDNYWVCAKLVDASAKTRYADGSPVSEGASYDVTVGMTSDQCGYGWIRLDHREILTVKDASGNIVRRLVWHKGGQDYNSPKPAYGWIDMADIQLFDGALDVSTADNVPHREGKGPKTEGMAPLGAPLVQSGSFVSGVPYWNNQKEIWDPGYALGKACEAEAQAYFYTVVSGDSTERIPESWQYKKNKSSSRYNKYADGGADYGDGSAKYAWLMWNFLTKADGETKLGGGGQMRGLLKNGQVFYRCKVKAIKAKAWEYMGTEQVGEITGWYIKTRGNNYSPWMYGWIIAEHRARNPDGSFEKAIAHYRKSKD